MLPSLQKLPQLFPRKSSFFQQRDQCALWNFAIMTRNNRTSSCSCVVKNVVASACVIQHETILFQETESVRAA